jgi:hypothetical protein
VATTLSLNEIRQRATSFAHDWQGVASERAEAQTFWNEFLQIFGINRRKFASFEERVKRLNDSTGRIDLFWPQMLLAEHKSLGQDLSKASVQAFKYVEGLPNKETPRFVIVSDFARFVLYDLDDHAAETHFTLAELPQHIEKLSVFAGYEPTKKYPDGDPITVEAAEKLGILHDALKEQGYTDHQLKLLMVRLMFILFAEDTGIFEKDHFRWCVDEKTKPDGSDLGGFLQSLFAVLDTPETQRQQATDEDLNRFCYVNGSMFTENIRPAHFNSTTRQLLLDCAKIDWAKVSPAIFGSMFQSAMNPTERRRLGAHYTSEKNILKLIDGLFLADYKAELAKLLADKSTQRTSKLKAFQAKLRETTLFDPACGCGNFLVIAYRELRELEHHVIAALNQSQQQRFDAALQSQVNVDQCYGIEIEEFPVQIARVALWLTDHQLNMRLSQQTGLHTVRLPLTTEPHIMQGNALRMAWDDVIPRERLSYLLGNPPFVGKKERSYEQTEDMDITFTTLKGAKNLDYVTCWYAKATAYTHGTTVKTAFVSTNSITQGEQVGILWPYLFNQGITLHFAHRTFKWVNEARGKAAVHCVIIGFGHQPVAQPVIFNYQEVDGEPLAVPAHNISPYLIPADNFVIIPRPQPLFNSLKLDYGSTPLDDGHLLIDAQTYNEISPELKQFFKPTLSSQKYFAGELRYCLWLKDVDPFQYRQHNFILEKIKSCKEYRLSRPRKATLKAALSPMLFGEIRKPESTFVVVPKVSSERRFYVPLSFFNSDYIPLNTMLFIDDANIYHYGVLQSLMHMAWMRVVTGRMKSDYQYSESIVYNNFPWPHDPSPAAVAKVEAAAQTVLDVRQPYLAQGNTLADLYDPNTMPAPLLKAHQTLDKAVDACYTRLTFKTELERVTFLFERYQALTAPLAKGLASKGKPRRGKGKP